MAKIKDFFESPHIQIALALGASIIILAWFSKRVLPQPIPDLQLAIPPFIATIFEAILGKYKNAKICTPWYWVCAIVLSAALVIMLNWAET